MRVLKVKVISLPHIFQVLYVLCFTRPRYQVSVYRTIGPLVTGCDVTLTSNYGMLFSPGYVGRINYPNNVMCTWTINANEPITIYFESDLQLVDDHKCIQDSNDFLQV